MTDDKELVERLRASGTANKAHNSDSVYMSICDEAASAIERLSAIEQERDALREALKPFVASKLPVMRKVARDFDENGLRRMMSPMEIAIKNARTALNQSGGE